MPLLHHHVPLLLLLPQHIIPNATTTSFAAWVGIIFILCDGAAKVFVVFSSLIERTSILSLSMIS